MENIYTVEEISKHLRVPLEAVQKEIDSGRLQALDIAGHLRITELALAEYMNNVRLKPNKNEAWQRPQDTGAQEREEWLSLQSASDFVHRWPDNKEEEYRNAREGVAISAGRQYHIKLGWTIRKSAGEERRRWLVLVDRYPTVEFVTCNDHGENGAEYTVSIIRDRKGKQVPALAAVPPEYKDLQTAVYSTKVKGPGTSNGQAVVCAANDFHTMVRHALIRTRYRQERR